MAATIALLFVPAGKTDRTGISGKVKYANLRFRAWTAERQEPWLWRIRILQMGLFVAARLLN